MEMEQWMDLALSVIGFLAVFLAAWWLDHNKQKSEKKITGLLERIKILPNIDHSINIR